MTQLLQQAFTEAAKLPELQQNVFANWILAELKSEQRWQESFAKSKDLLAQLADEAVAEHRLGRTLPLDPEQL